jgi:hypothetical protein
VNLPVRGTVMSVRSEGQGGSPGMPTGPDDPAFAKRILCEGDSWFSIGAIPSSNILFPLQFRQATLLYNLAQPGDTIRRMSDISKNPDLFQYIAKQNFLTKWDAIFLSGGGNDLIDKAPQIICRPSVGAGGHMMDYINNIELAKLKIEIQAGYKRIAELRNGNSNQATPIIAHVYDYPTPREAKAKFLVFGVAGPWLYPAFKQSDVPESLWISVTDFIFEWLGSVIIDLQGKIDNFHVISNTRETLIRARLGTTGADGDWLNEIHPTAEGYEKLSQVISPEIDNVLYDGH